MKALLGIFDVVPGWIWATLLAGAALTNCATQTKLQSQRLETANLKTEAAQRAKIQAEALSVEVEKTRAIERKLADASIRQEKTDANNKTIVADLGRDLADRRLLDPFARGCDAAKAEATGNPASGEGHSAQANRTLSIEFDSFLKQLTSDADEINIAYASCRETVINDREALK